MTEFDAALRELAPPWRRSLELAYRSLADGGLAVGAVLTDGDGMIVAEGRNRAYDPPGGLDVLQRSPVAHAEMNVLAAISIERDLSACTLSSTHEPCSMCVAAAAFTGVGTVRYLAPDPWAMAEGRSRGPASRDHFVLGPVRGPWMVSANLLFLLSVGMARGVEHSTILAHREFEPATARFVIDLLGDAARTKADLSGTFEAFMRPRWDRIELAASRQGE